MTEQRTADTIPLPDYEVEQYFPRDTDLGDEQRSRLREQYGYVRTWFKCRPASYRDLQRWLNQSRTGTTYDKWMADTVRYAAVAGLGGGSLGLLLSLWLVHLGAFADLGGSLAAPGALAPLFAPLVPYSAAIATAAVTFALGGVFAGAVYAIRYYQPLVRARLRGRGIDVVLPHAIVYMYALSHGGMNFIEVLRSIADEEDYGEVADEFDMVIRDMELFGNDLYTALRNARNLTPSSNFEQFLDDLLSVLDSGGDVTAFLDDESGVYMEEAMEEQENFLETLSMLSEIFIAAFVAAPLLLIVTLIVISFLGGDTLMQLYALNYLIFPLGMALFLLFVDMLSQPFDQEAHAPAVRSTAAEELREVVADAVAHARREIRSAIEDRWSSLDLGDLGGPGGAGGSGDGAGGSDLVPRPGTPQTDGGAVDLRFEQYRRHNAFGALLRLLGDPVTLVRRQPLLTTVVTVPLAVAALAGALVLGLATPSWDAVSTDPVWTTFWLVLCPLGVVAVPLSAFHELERRRARAIERRFPDTLNVLSSANQMGIPLVEGLELVARWSSGVLAEELRKLHNDVTWNGQVVDGLYAFAERLAVPSLGRVIRLIATGGQSSGDLSRVLSVAAADTRNRYKLDRARRNAMSTYIAIVIIGFLVYLFVIVMLSTSYLAPIETISGTTGAGSADMPMNLGAIPIDSYRAVFFHSAVIQAVGSGMLAGKLSDNDSLSGLKYSIALTALAMLAFVFV